MFLKQDSYFKTFTNFHSHSLNNTILNKNLRLYSIQKQKFHNDLFRSELENMFSNYDINYMEDVILLRTFLMILDKRSSEKELSEGNLCHFYAQGSTESNYDQMKIKEQISKGQK